MRDLGCGAQTYGDVCGETEGSDEGDADVAGDEENV